MSADTFMPRMRRVTGLPATGAAIGIGVACALAAAWRRRRHTLPPVPVTVAAPLVELLGRRGLTVAIAESCTGGVLSALLTGVRGAGDVFRGGIVAYANEAKRDLLGVSDEILNGAGAVSEEAALAMARGARQALGADVGVAVTGLVGEGREGKPTGLVFVGVVSPGGMERCIRLDDDHGPEGNREEAARVAFGLAEELVRAQAA